MLEIRTNAKQLAKRLKRIATRLRRGTQGVLDDWAREVINLVKTHSFGTSDSQLQSRTGHLIQQFESTTKRQGDDYIARLANYAKYAALHEYGGVITPKRAKKIAIPLPPVKTPAGAQRYTSPLRQTLPGHNFVQRSGGELYLYHDEGGQPVPWFKLVSRVAIPARLNLRKTTREQLDDLAKRVGKRFQATMTHGR